MLVPPGSTTRHPDAGMDADAGNYGSGPQATTPNLPLDRAARRQRFFGSPPLPTKTDQLKILRLVNVPNHTRVRTWHCGDWSRPKEMTRPLIDL